MYIHGQRLDSIATELGVSYGTIHGWHNRERWASIRKQMRSDLLEGWKQRCKAGAIIASWRLVADHLRIADRFVHRMEEALNRESVSVEELYCLAKALSTEFRALEPLLKPVWSGRPGSAENASLMTAESAQHPFLPALATSS